MSTPSGDGCLIPLSGKHGAGHFAITSPEDFDRLSQNLWRGELSNGKLYAYLRCRRPPPMHTVVLGRIPGLVIDHINGNTLDNRRENLRHCTVAENLRNRAMARHNVSGFKGVYRALDRKKIWRAAIRFNGKHLKIGSYATAVEAALAYDEAARRLHGEYARTNF